MRSAQLRIVSARTKRRKSFAHIHIEAHHRVTDTAVIPVKHPAHDGAQWPRPPTGLPIARLQTGVYDDHGNSGNGFSFHSHYHNLIFSPAISTQNKQNNTEHNKSKKNGPEYEHHGHVTPLCL